jgi:putative chitinase
MSDAMRKLQIKIGGCGSDGAFGPNTARAIANFYGLSPERGAREGLYYSTAERIQAVWPSRFPTVESAEPYARNPSGLANKVYSDRMGNGDESSQEGALFSGKGFLQLTGKSNFRAFASDMRLPEVMTNPDAVATDYAFETAQWFFNKNGLFKIADEGVNDDTIKRITRKVNGGYHGLEDRTEQTNKIHTWLMDA